MARLSDLTGDIEFANEKYTSSNNMEDAVNAILSDVDHNPEVIVDPYSRSGWSYRGQEVNSDGSPFNTGGFANEVVNPEPYNPPTTYNPPNLISSIIRSLRGGSSPTPQASDTRDSTDLGSKNPLAKAKGWGIPYEGIDPNTGVAEDQTSYAKVSDLLKLPFTNVMVNREGKGADWYENLPEPIKNTVGTIASPAGVAFLPTGITGAGVKGVGTAVGRNITSVLGAELGASGARKYTPKSGIPTPLGNIPKPVVTGVAGLAGGVAGFQAPEIAKGISKAVPATFRGLKTAGGELTTGRLASETGAIDFRRLDDVIDSRTGLPAKVMSDPPAGATETSTVRVKLEGKPGTEIRRLDELTRPEMPTPPIPIESAPSVSSARPRSEPNIISKMSTERLQEIYNAGHIPGTKDNPNIYNIGKELERRGAAIIDDVTPPIAEPTITAPKTTPRVSTARKSPTKVTTAQATPEEQAIIDNLRNSGMTAPDDVLLKQIRKTTEIGAVTKAAPIVEATPSGPPSAKPSTNIADEAVPPTPPKSRLTVMSAGEAPKPPEAKNATRKILDVVDSVLNIPREIMSLGDPFGTSLRQLRPLMSHPKTWYKSGIVAQGKAFVSEAKFNEATDAIKNHPNFDTIFGKKGFNIPLEGDNAFSEITGTGLVGKGLEKGAHVLRKGGTLGKIASAAPDLLSGTERAYNLALNTARLLRGQSVIDSYAKHPDDLTEALMKEWGNSIMHQTGRGTGELLDIAGKQASLGIFSPRLWAGRLQVFTDPFMPRMNPKVRLEAARTLVTLLGTSAAAMEISHRLGLETGTDILHGQFGQVGPKGHTVDITGGFATEARNLTRIAKGESTNYKGEHISKPRIALAKKYVSGKLNPIVGAGISAETGKMYPYNETADDATWGAVTQNILSPLSLKDILQSWNTVYPENKYGSAEDLKTDLANILKNPSDGFKALFTTGGALGGAGPQIDIPSAYDRRDIEANKQSGGKYTYNELPDYDKEGLPSKATVDAVTGKIASTNPDVLERKSDIEELHKENIKTQLQIDAKYGVSNNVPQGSHPFIIEPKSGEDGKKWRDEYQKAQYGIKQQWRTLEQTDKATYNSIPTAQREALNEYFSLLDELEIGTKIEDWSKIDQWKENNPEKSDWVDRYMSGKPNTDLTPMITAYKTASEKISDSGYFDLSETILQKFLPKYTKLQGFKTIYDYEQAEMDKLTSKMSQSSAEKLIASNPVIKDVKEYTNIMEDKWIRENPEAAALAIKWGYMSYPSENSTNYLTSRGYLKK